MFDILIKNGNVVAGDGSEPVKQDIGIAKERIVAIENYIPADSALTVIDASGLLVTPGFVDIHSHADLYPINQNNVPILLLQGITTVIAGHCGLSVAPCLREYHSLWRSMYEKSFWGESSFVWEWESMAQYLDCFNKNSIAANFATFTGLGAIRLTLTGPSSKEVTPQEIYEACLKNIDEGSLGISLGPYFPCGYAKKEELEAAALAVAKKNAVLSVHMSSYGDELLESSEKYINIARKTGCNLEISHLHAAGKRNWHKLEKVIEVIEKANNQGLNINFDRHCYAAGSTPLVALLPPWAQEGGNNAIKNRLLNKQIRDKIRSDLKTGLPYWDCLVSLAGWDCIVVLINIEGEDKLRYSNKNLDEISKQEGLDPVDVLCKIIIKYGDKAAMIIHHMEEQGVIDVLTHNLGMIGSDSNFVEHPHPRTYGNYAKWFGYYIRDKKILSVGDAVYKCTAMPCSKHGINMRGLLRPNYYGDINIIDWQNFFETGTYDEPESYPTGIRYVLVNGQPVVFQGEITGKCPGNILINS
jgi:N-acyl-D-aspartate/D-glutamate deacylase